MSVCPSYNQCINPACEANRCCMNADYWAKYWRNRVPVKAILIEKESKNKTFKYIEPIMPPHVFCCYCKKETIELRDYTKEHLVPRSKGGNNTLLNKKPCCKSCSGNRGNDALQLWVRDMAVRVKYLPEHSFTANLFNARIERALHWIDYIEEQGANLYRSKWHYENRSLLI